MVVVVVVHDDYVMILISLLTHHDHTHRVTMMMMSDEYVYISSQPKNKVKELLRFTIILNMLFVLHSCTF